MPRKPRFTDGFIVGFIVGRIVAFLPIALAITGLAVGLVYFGGGAAAQDQAVSIRVRLSTGVPVRFRILGEALVYRLVTESTPVMPAMSPEGGSEWEVRASPDSAEITLVGPDGTGATFYGGIQIVPDKVQNGTQNGDQTGFQNKTPFFSMGGRSYAGAIEIFRNLSLEGQPETVVVNVIDVEDYVKGVLGGEVSPAWELEALKAQAVAARTYVLRKRNTNAGRGYDVDDTPSRYQKYIGYSAEGSFVRAVEETRGEVITYRGAIISAVYCASTGGYTEGDEDIWMLGDEPYLSAVEDYDQGSPYYFWPSPKVFTGAELLAKLGIANGCPATVEPLLNQGGKIVRYKFTAQDQVQDQAQDQAQAQSQAQGRTKTFTREDLRRGLGFRSPRFEVVVVRRVEVAGSTVSESGKMNNSGDTSFSGFMRIPLETAILLYPSDIIVFDGKGYGHGVGLSQWGAQGMAAMRDEETGQPRYNYIDILKHYYTGVEIVGNYGKGSFGSPTQPSITAL